MERPGSQRFGVRLPLEVTKEQAMYFAPRDTTAFAFRRISGLDLDGRPVVLRFSGLRRKGAVKITQDAGGKAVDPDTRGFEPDPAITQRVRGFVANVLAFRRSDRERVVKTCLYTLTPDRDFVIDTLPEHPNVHVAIGAGHAFKFASVIGRILSDLALDGSTESPIDAFTIDRPILQMEAPPKTYMV